MDSDMIVVLCLAIVFFGGISYLVWKERDTKKQTVEVKTLSQEARQTAGRLNKEKSKAFRS